MSKKFDDAIRVSYSRTEEVAHASLVEHPLVRESCVIGVPDPVSGESPHAYVLLQPGGVQDAGHGKGVDARAGRRLQVSG